MNAATAVSGSQDRAARSPGEFVQLQLCNMAEPAVLAAELATAQQALSEDVEAGLRQVSSALARAAGAWTAGEDSALAAVRAAAAALTHALLGLATQPTAM